MKKTDLILKAVFVLALIFSLSTAAFAYEEAPMLKEKVEAGELPPVEERLPENPLVIEPLREIGKYGGTWHRFGTAENWAFFREALIGHSFTRFVDDGLRLIPNLLESWESNEDKSVWTLHFRKGVKWSDGEPFTVDDVLFWWNDMVLHPGHTAPLFDMYKSAGEVMEMQKVDDFTLKYVFSAPAPLLIKRIAINPKTGQFGHQVVPSHYLKQFHPDYSEEYDTFETFDEKREYWHNVDCPVLTAWMPVKEESGKRIVFERNPYYYAVDTEGNQLPYIDEVNVRYLADNEIFKLKLINGESDMQIRPGTLGIRDIATLKANANKHNYRTLLWDSGSGTGPVYYVNQNHPDPEKQSLYQNSKFLKALSHAIDRNKIQKMIFYNQGYPTTGTFSSKDVEYHRTEEGKEIFKQWRDLAVEYDPDKAAGLLEEIGVVDQNGDGWRETPSGKELKLRIDTDSGASERYMDTTETVKAAWRGVGLKTIVNPVDGSKISVMETNGTFDIRNSWEVANPHNHLLNGRWLVPIDNQRWAPLYGAWDKVRGTEKEGTELDKDPRDRTPPRVKPPQGSPIDRLQKIHKKAVSEPDPLERDKLVFEMIRIHMEHGPFFIGTVADYPRVGVVKNYMKNVPTRDELPLGGFVNPWFMYIGGVTPPQFYIDK